MAFLARAPRPAPNDGSLYTAAAGAAATVGGGLLAVSAYTIGLWVLPAAIVAIAFVATAALRPAWGVAGALVAVPAESLDVTVGGVSPSEAGLALVGGLWACRALVRPETVQLPQLRDAPLIVLLFTIGIGLTHAQDPAPIARVLVLWTLFYFVYLQTQTFRPEEMRLILVLFALGTAVLGGQGILDYLRSGDQQLFAGGELTGARAASAFADPNYYASLLVLALLPAMGLVLAYPRRYAYLAVACVVIFGGIALSLSRGGLLAAVTGAALLLAWRRARWIALGAAGLLVVLTLAGGNPLTETKQFQVVEERISTLKKPGVERRNPRAAIWATARSVTAAHPFFGVGVSQFRFETARRNVTQEGSPFENAHSIIFSLAAETGLIGLTAFLWWLGQIGTKAVRALRTKDTLRYALALGMAGAALGFILQGLTVAQIRVSVIAGTFFVIAGMLVGLGDRAESDRA